MLVRHVEVAQYDRTFVYPQDGAAMAPVQNFRISLRRNIDQKQPGPQVQDRTRKGNAAGAFLNGAALVACGQLGAQISTGQYR